MIHRFAIRVCLVLLRWSDAAYNLAQRHGDWVEDERLSREDTLRLFDRLAGLGEPVEVNYVGSTPPYSWSVSTKPQTWATGSGVNITWKARR